MGELFSDCGVVSKMKEKQTPEIESIVEENKNTVYVVALFTMTFAVIARDWRKRDWK